MMFKKVQNFNKIKKGLKPLFLYLFYMRKVKIEQIPTLLSYHVQTQYLSYSQISEIYDLIPEHCKYEGIGFRAIVKVDINNVRPDELSNLYWSSSISGIKKYLRISRYEQALVFKANIKGVDLNKTLDWLNSLTPEKYPRNNPHCDEDEILVIGYSDFDLYNLS